MSEPNADILIVDDTPANLRLLASMLAQRGYKATRFRAGRSPSRPSGASRRS